MELIDLDRAPVVKAERNEKSCEKSMLQLELESVCKELELKEITSKGSNHYSFFLYRDLGMFLSSFLILFSHF
jgi:hypothetical protein